ncbi:Aste57867_10306 [Aphanomyces stellatus]|uniref:Trimethylguanosine synthase n=1 Tax=Aphanomyces stellatus TaxID=120398 RepID=A0A485KQI1_9STRA|nr:hypothetical protein As57867_010266 [Aphanomyces stellatus]VFT87180.1 Aste57867_10306 [Aphanomyces stellatus]
MTSVRTSPHANNASLPSSQPRLSNNRSRNSQTRRKGQPKTSIQVPTEVPHDSIEAKLAALKLSPSSSASTTSTSSLSLHEQQTPPKSSGAKRQSGSKKKSTKSPSPPPSTDNQDDVDARPLNDNELSLWQALTSGNKTASDDDNDVPPSPDKAQKQLKKNRTTNDPNDKRDFLFGGISPDLRIQLQLDDVAQYSVTDTKTAARISHFLMSLDGLTPASVITDGTACVGGNTASFCTFFRYVQAVEIDPTRFQMLVHNMHAVLGHVNIQCFCASYVDVAQCFYQDVVFMDPPWGGPEYRSRSTVDLFLGETPLATVCEALIGRTQYVVIKVPENFDLDKFTANVSGLVGCVSTFRKMMLVYVDYRYVEPTTPLDVSVEELFAAADAQASSM